MTLSELLPCPFCGSGTTQRAAHGVPLRLKARSTF